MINIKSHRGRSKGPFMPKKHGGSLEKWAGNSFTRTNLHIINALCEFLHLYWKLINWLGWFENEMSLSVCSGAPANCQRSYVDGRVGTLYCWITAGDYWTPLFKTVFWRYARFMHCCISLAWEVLSLMMITVKISHHFTVMVVISVLWFMVC